MAAMYDELGNYIGDDSDPNVPTPMSVDAMKYELAKNNRLKDAVNNVRAFYEMLPGTQALRRASAIPEAAMSIGSTMLSSVPALPYAISKGIEAGEYGKSTKTAEKAFQEAVNMMTYQPRTQQGRELMRAIEAAPKAITGSEMGFGPVPELWALSAGRFSPDDLRVAAKQNIERARELRAIPEDFTAAQSGLRRESALGGETYGATLQRATEDIGDVLARRSAMGKSTFAGIPDVLVPETNLYAVKPTGGQLVKAIDPITNELRDLPESSIAGISNAYEAVRKPTTGQPLINEYMRRFVSRPEFQPLWEDFTLQKTKEEFPDAPSLDSAREAFGVKYKTPAARNARLVEQFNEFSTLPQVQATAATLGINVPTFEEYQQRVDAANQWAQKGFANYIQKYVGTKEDPVLKLATEGITFRDPERVTEAATDVMNYTSSDELREKRKEAGFNPEGEIQPFLKEKLFELKAVDLQLRDMITRRNALYEQAREAQVDPATNPEYADLTNKVTNKIAEKERLTQQVENYKVGKAYETLADVAVAPQTARNLRRRLSYAERQLFPYLEKTPDEAVLYNVDPTVLGRMGLTDIATDFMNDIVTGKIPVEQIGNVSIPKYIQKAATERMASQAAIKKELANQEKRLNDYLQTQVQSIPQDKVFSGVAALEITNAMDPADIARALSADTVVLDHCVGQGGRGTNGRQYTPIVNPVDGTVPRGSSGEDTSYVRNIVKNGDIITSLRDVITGKPVGTLELNKTDTGYMLGYASGYQNGPISPEYSRSLKEYLNSISDKLGGTGEYLTKNGVLDQENLTPAQLREVTGLTKKDLEKLDLRDLPRFVTRDDVLELYDQSKALSATSQLDNETATLNNAYRDLLEENQRLEFALQNAEDDVVRDELLARRDEIRSELTDVTSRIGDRPEEEIAAVARAALQDLFGNEQKSPRTKLAILDNETPVGLRIQHRIHQKMIELLREERDAVGSPLTLAQQRSVEDEWERVSNFIINERMAGNMYHGDAIANNIRVNPDAYNLGAYDAQVIDGIARRIEERGLLDPRNLPLPRIDADASTLPPLIIDRLDRLFGNAIQRDDPMFENAIAKLREAQAIYQNPPNTSLLRELTQQQLNEAIGEIQLRIEDLERRADRPVLINNARRGERAARAQMQDLGIVLERLKEAIEEDFGLDVREYVTELLNTSHYDVTVDPALYIESVRRRAEVEQDPDVISALDMIADRLTQGMRMNVRLARETAPAEVESPVHVGNIVQNIINQYPEPQQIQRVIDGLERGENDLLPAQLREADEQVYDATLGEILAQLEMYRDSVVNENRGVDDIARRGNAPEGRKAGGYIQKPQNELLSHNIDDMRLTLAQRTK